MVSFRTTISLLGLCLVGFHAMAQSTFTNPLFPPESADPWVIRHDGWYYFCCTTGGDVTLRRAATLPELAQAAPVVVFRAAPHGPIKAHIWAPELHFINGHAYIYTCGNTVGDYTRYPQQMFVLEARTADPLGPYDFKAFLAPGTAAIDDTVLTRPSDGMRFLVWSQFDPEGQCLYIAPLVDPWTVGAPRRRLSKPEYDWETGGQGRVNEGPEILRHGTKTFIVYSASGCWSRDYCLGLLTNVDGDYLNPEAWKKSTHPVFQQSEANGVYGVGHCSFTVSPDGRQEWLVYHGMSDPNGGQPNRSTRLQPFTWNDDGTPHFGEPLKAGQPLPMSSNVKDPTR